MARLPKPSSFSMKAQFKAANRKAVRAVVIRGDEEMNAGTAQIKNMEEGSQREVAIDALAGELQTELGLK